MPNLSVPSFHVHLWSRDQEHVVPAISFSTLLSCRMERHLHLRYQANLSLSRSRKYIHLLWLTLSQRSFFEYGVTIQTVPIHDLHSNQLHNVSKRIHSRSITSVGDFNKLYSGKTSRTILSYSSRVHYFLSYNWPTG